MWGELTALKCFYPGNFINLQWVQLEGIIQVPRLLAIVIVSRVCSNQNFYKKNNMVKSVLNNE